VVTFYSLDERQSNSFSGGVTKALEKVYPNNKASLLTEGAIDERRGEGEEEMRTKIGSLSAVQPADRFYQ